MSKTLIEAPITTRNARSKLDRGVHWRALAVDTHLGYRRGVRAGKWLVRWRIGTGYKQAPLGAADDALEADGAETLNFHQALAAAKAHVEAARAQAKAEADGPAPTVRSAVEHYVAERERRDHDTGDARSRLGKHVLGDKVADMALYTLRERDLADWRSRLPSELAAGTIKRLANDFRAALNAAGSRHKATLPADFGATVRDAFKATGRSQAVAREMQVLDDDEVRRIVDAARSVDAGDNWSGDLARLIIALAATGARFSQVARMTVADVQPAQRRLMVPTSRKGADGKIARRAGVPVGDDVLAALRPALAGRRSTERLLERWRHQQTAPMAWERVGRGPWTSAAEMVRPWREILELAGIGQAATPYSLRHSSIVRGLRSGLPIRLVAALHDTSSAMIEQHYSAYIVDALDELAARAVIPLTAVESTAAKHDRP